MTYKIREDVKQEWDKWLAEVLEAGCKYGDNNWLQKNGVKCSHKEMHDSMFHHLACSFAGHQIDPDDKIYHLKKLMTRAGMELYLELHVRGKV